MNIDEIKRFITLGYLPTNLPKMFSSFSFGDSFTAYMDLCEKNKSTAPYKYDVYKKKYATREFSILNPYNFALLTKKLGEYWDVTAEASNKSRLTVTPIQLGAEDGEQAIIQISKEQFQKLVFAKSAGMNTLLRTDVSEHYGSTYTHSLSWAVHGKDEVRRLRNEQFVGNKQQRKAAKEVYDALPGNVLDRVLRDGDEQQTYGIPTGPDTSRIVSEIIMSSVDEQIRNKLDSRGIKFTGGRYVDDYEMYFETEIDAKQAIKIITKVLGSYRYKINEQKTNFTSSPPIGRSEEWSTKLGHLVPSDLYSEDLDEYSVDSSVLSFSRVKHFIEEFVALSEELGDYRILRKAVSRYLRKYKCSDDDWDYYEIHLLQLLAHYPNLAKPVFDIIQKHEKGDSVNLQDTVNKKLLDINLTAYDAMWLIYGALAFNVFVDPPAVENLIEQDDPMIWLMILGLYERNLADINIDLIQNAWSNYSLDDEGWMFKYEAVRRSWLSDVEGIITKDPFFLRLALAGVSFFNTNSSELQLNESDWLGDYDEPRRNDVTEQFIPDDLDWIPHSNEW